MAADVDPRDNLEPLTHARRVLIALDFDGTLAPLVDNPDDARMTPRARQALDRLTNAPGVTIALISGRGAKNLAEVSSPDPTWWVVGSHGIEVVAPGGDQAVVPTPELDAKRRQLWEEFRVAAENHPGVWVEKKTWGSAVHTRGVESSVEKAIHQTLGHTIARWGGELTTRTGHGILEASFGDQNKGDGLTQVTRTTQPTLTVFIGDDVTDEDGFAALGPSDVGVKVGTGASLAQYRLDGVDDVADFLDQVAHCRLG